MAHRPAGGPKSRQVTQKPVRYGAAGGANQISVKASSQLGTSVGTHVTGKGKVLRGTIREVFPGAMGGMGAVKLGNELAGNVGAGGPGAGRSVYRSGFQGTHGAVNPGKSPERKDILSEYGSDHAYARKR